MTQGKAAEATAKHLVEDLMRKVGGGWSLLGVPLQEALALAEVLHRFACYDGSARTARDLVEEMNAVRIAVLRRINPDAFADVE